MHIHLRQLAAFAVLTVGGAVYSAIPATAQEQEHRDASARDAQTRQTYSSDNSKYYSNKYYRLGNQEGLQDNKRNTQRTTHNHSYRNDDDRKAHDYGYHEGWQGRNYHDADRDPH